MADPEVAPDYLLDHWLSDLHAAGLTAPQIEITTNLLRVAWRVATKHAHPDRAKLVVAAIAWPDVSARACKSEVNAPTIACERAEEAAFRPCKAEQTNKPFTRHTKIEREYVMRLERESKRIRVENAAMRAASTALLAALDTHEDATDPVFGEAYHHDHADAVYAAKCKLRDAIKEYA